MGYKILRSVNIPKNKQVLIKATCLDFRDQPYDIKLKIINLSASCGGEYGYWLFRVMTKGDSIISASMKCPCSEKTLERARKKFYENWDK
ncbi:MAG: hypothetical protein FWE47_00095 [Oscillospiraceae bacterium]|nr:hypothetical protein [Oscillospiraceae bacterium]